MNIGLAIVGHEARKDQIHRLDQAVSAHHIALDDGSLGEWANHELAWQKLHAEGFSHGIVLQDDALPIDSFIPHAETAISARPDDCISFYVGTSYPLQLNATVPGRIERATVEGYSWLASNKLYWGVGVALPLSLVPEMLASYNGMAYDEYIGWYCRRVGVRVSYTWPSFVDHEDGPTLVKHWDGLKRDKPRKAYRTGPQQDPIDERSISI